MTLMDDFVRRNLDAYARFLEECAMRTAAALGCDPLDLVMVEGPPGEPVEFVHRRDIFGDD